MKQINNENHNHRKIRERLVMENYHAEIELLTLRAVSNEEKLKKIDVDMKNDIKIKANINTQCELWKMWEENCLTEETKSLQRWEKNLQWLEKYATQFKSQQTCKEQSPFNKTKTYADAVKQNNTFSQARYTNNIQQQNFMRTWSLSRNRDQFSNYSRNNQYFQQDHNKTT